MDVKAIANTQSSVQMNSQHIETQKAQMAKGAEEVNKEGKENEIQKELKEIKELPKNIIEEAAKNLEKKLSMLNSQLKIETDEETGIQVVRIIDKNTKEVIRQLPPEAILKIAKYVDELTGMLFDTKA